MVERAGLRRRDLLRLGATLPLAAGVVSRVAVAPARATAAATTPIVKPLPPEWFVNYGTNAEMRWESARASATRSPTSASSCATTPPLR